MNCLKRLVASFLLCAMLMGLSVAGAQGSRYWARSQGSILYESPGNGIKRSMPAVEAFQVVGEQGDWLAVETIASGQMRIKGWVEKKGVYSIEGGLDQAIAVVNNPNSQDRLHLRAQPRADSISKGKYFNGALVFVHHVRNGWAKVRIAEETGYMQAKYLLFGADALSYTQSPPMVTIQNHGGQGLRLRFGPSTGASNGGLYLNGVSVMALGLTREWVHVQPLQSDLSGYMLLRHLSPRLQYDLDSSAASGPPAPNPPAPQTPKPLQGDWPENQGPHATADWPLTMGGRVAGVSNPNPADRLHLRTQPRSSAFSLGKYYNGVQAQVLGDAVKGWVPVQIGILKGYMDERFLVAGAPGPSYPASAMPILQVYNPGDMANLHLRERQSTGSRSLGLYPNGTSVVLMGFDTSWAHVIVGGQTGFMLKKFLR